MLSARGGTAAARGLPCRKDVPAVPGVAAGVADGAALPVGSGEPTPVSVITASYNYARLLPEALDSVLAQTYGNWELLAVDDGSADASREVLEAYAARDGRIRVFRHEDGGNHGLPATLRLGLAQARFSLIAFLEADDVWEPDSLARRVRALEGTGADVCWSAVRPLPEEGVDSRDVERHFRVAAGYFSRLRPPFAMTAALHGRCLLPTFSCVLVRRDALRACDFFPPEGAWLDWWLWQQLALRASFVFVPEPLTVWRLHKASYTRSLDAATEAARRGRFAAAARAALLPEAWRRRRPGWIWALCFPRSADLVLRAALRCAAEGPAGLWDALRRRLPGGARTRPGRA